MNAWAIDIDRDDVTKAEIVTADTSVGHGEILVQIDSYAMTANNVTYAVFGKPAGLFGNDLAVNNGEPSWTLPMPARYVIGQDGVIAYAEVNPDYTRRPDPEELVPVLQKLQAAI